MDLEELRSVREQERRTDSLQHLRDSFYDDAAEYIGQLKHERSRRAEQAGDPYATAAMRLTDEIDTAEEVIESLYERRRGKVVKLASFAAAGMPAETDGMTEQERSMFDDVVERAEKNEERVLGALDGGADGPATHVGGELSDATPGVPGTTGTAAASDAARTSVEAATGDTASEADTVGAAGETDALGVGDGTDDPGPAGAAATPGTSEEPVAAETDGRSPTPDGAAADGAGGTDGRSPTPDGAAADGAGGTSDGSVLADAMSGPAPSGGEPPGGGAPTGETPPATDRADGSTAESSEEVDRPAAEAAVATGVAEPSGAGNGTDTVGRPGATPSTGGTTDPSAAADEAATETPTPTTADSTPTADTPAPTEDGTPTGDESAADDTPAVERSTVRVTDDVGEVFGVDDRTYELAASDVVHLPQVVAEPLVERGAAERL